MANTFRLGRTNQCAKCPWKVSTDPHQIPNGYSCELHQGLASTIAQPGPAGLGGELQIMACHESPESKPQHCIGWLENQMGRGNNLGLRLHMMRCENIGAMKLDGPQHKRFKDTLPR